MNISHVSRREERTGNVVTGGKRVNKMKHATSTSFGITPANKFSIGTASVNSVEFRGIRPRMYIEALL